MSTPNSSFAVFLFPFLFAFVLFFFAFVDFLLFTAVRPVELPGEGDPVAGVVDARARRPVEQVIEEPDADLPLVHLRPGVLHETGRGLVVPGAVRVAASPGEPVGTAGLRPDAAADAFVSAGPVDVRLAAEARRRAVREVGGHRDDVHRAPDGVRAVEQGRGSANHFDALRLERVHRDAVVGGLAAQVSRPDAVLHEQDPVSVEAPHDRPRRTRPEAPDSDPRGPFQELRDVARRLVRQVESLD